MSTMTSATPTRVARISNSSSGKAARWMQMPGTQTSKLTPPLTRRLLHSRLHPKRTQAVSRPPRWDRRPVHSPPPHRQDLRPARMRHRSSKPGSNSSPRRPKVHGALNHNSPRSGSQQHRPHRADGAEIRRQRSKLLGPARRALLGRVVIPQPRRCRRRRRNRRRDRRSRSSSSSS